MGRRTALYFGILCLVTTTISANVNELKSKAVMINKAGSLAAGFSALGDSAVDSSAVDEMFAELGSDIQIVAREWARDEELRDAPPAFRRFLFFEYLTGGTSTVAGSSNPPDRLINVDAAVGNLIADEQVAEEARSLMDQGVAEPVFREVGDFFLAAFPMVPSRENASKCIACHASTEVNRPYPPGTHVLGYTFIVQQRKF